jgi:hypothetical protein
MYIDGMQAEIRHSGFCCVDSYGSLWARCVVNPCVTRVSFRVKQAYGGSLEKDGSCAFRKNRDLADDPDFVSG